MKHKTEKNTITLDKQSKKDSHKVKNKTSIFSKKTSNKTSLPRTAQDTVPIIEFYKKGIIETSPGNFSKTYQLNDANFSLAPDEEQITMFSRYEKFLNTFNSDTHLEITVNNRNINEETLLKNTLLKTRQDNLNHLRDEMNNVLKSKLSEGRNNLVSDKYFTISTKASDIKDAARVFSRLDSEINAGIKTVVGSQTSETKPLSTEKRIKVLHDIINVGNEDSLPDNINIQDILNSGLSIKDVISPSGFQFYPNYFKMGDKFARVLFIKHLPNVMSTDFLSEISALPFNLTTSIYLEPIDVDKALSIVKTQMTNINADVIKAQKTAAKEGYGANLISSDLRFAQEQGENLISDLRGRNQKAFFFTGTIMHYADSLEELDKDTKSIITLGNRFLCTISKLTFQQEYGFRNALPLGINDLSLRRLLPTESAALFIPFSTQELMQDGGVYYGLNALSNNMLLFNRLNSKNQNGVILGQPGSGKSFTAKREIITIFLSTDDDIYIIDPEEEYTSMTIALGGEHIHLEAGSNVYINPFDMDIQYANEEDGQRDPVTMKSDYICMLCETAMSGRYQLTSGEKSIIDRCVRELYKPYLKHMSTLPAEITCDTSASPTMDSFYELLMSQPEPDAQNIALSLEIYCRGSFDTFAHHTNVDINNRLVVYDIKDIGTGMLELGLQVCLNHVWNKIISNKSKNKRTWFYIDEFHMLTKTESSSTFLLQIWKRARKWAGVPTAITQNVGDLLKTDTAQEILNNCELVIMMSQSPIDRMSLANLYHISDAQLAYITDAPPGQGLMHTGRTIVPFKDNFPEDTLLFDIMSTKPKIQARAVV